MPKVAIFISYSGDGGVEKMIGHLATGFLAAGVAVDLILIKAVGGHLAAIPAGVRIIKLDARTSLFSLPWLVRYLRRERPAALLAAKDRAARVALLARRLAGVPTRVVLRLGMHLSQSLEGKSRLAKALRYYPVRWLYPWADGIICVSDGMADDMAAITGLPRSRLKVIANPTVTPELQRLAAEAPDNDWFNAPGPPRLVAVGRLTRQKGFDVLLQAFSRLQERQPCRLLILGEGGDRSKLEAEVRRLKLDHLVQLPGFVVNPYAYLARADLFVLSSRFEGSPNALKEALALGVPVVATDCRSGPRQILQEGKYGPLVPVDDPEALALAMSRVLAAPPDRALLPRAVAAYTVEASSRAYLAEMGVIEG
ncbi:glycosyl transferase group 1 [Desulfurivibrio alkaliphilus AHT 2]|uniref:Glycosyl transferase group 1 n=1 Tax=Desulfurivibrio alkaliphilus (strain DSM 19089 / UNIQEM U267 / AHT2) TaxID=589865 RepID=D6Z2M0_DESAT|nr:glycosyltransferase [Desulfurivibrio alkaliphilus]ADH85795.1 glycosyl transferase group 1 [Desulfurivibrio alkaliphilus AHT 2]